MSSPVVSFMPKLRNQASVSFSEVLSRMMYERRYPMMDKNITTAMMLSRLATSLVISIRFPFEDDSGSVHRCL